MRVRQGPEMCLEGAEQGETASPHTATMSLTPVQGAIAQGVLGTGEGLVWKGFGVC